MFAVGVTVNRGVTLLQAGVFLQFDAVWLQYEMITQGSSAVKHHEWLHAMSRLWTGQRSLRTTRGFFFALKAAGGFCVQSQPEPSLKAAHLPAE